MKPPPSDTYLIVRTFLGLAFYTFFHQALIYYLESLVWWLEGKFSFSGENVKAIVRSGMNLKSWPKLL